MNTPLNAEDWRIADLLSRPEDVFVLWALQEGLCSSVDDFAAHFRVGGDHAEVSAQQIIVRLEAKGFLTKRGERLTLTESAHDALTRLTESQLQARVEALQQAAPMITPSAMPDAPLAEQAKESELKGSAPGRVVTPTTTVFISYARTESAFVDRLYTDLQKSGYMPWMDRRDLMAGQDALRQIHHALDTCQVLLLVLSPTSLTVKAVSEEYRRFLAAGKPVLPLLYQPGGTVPLELYPIQWIDFESAHRYRVGLRELLSALAAYSTKQSVTNSDSGASALAVTTRLMQGQPFRGRWNIFATELETILNAHGLTINRLAALRVPDPRTGVVRDLIHREQGRRLAISLTTPESLPTLSASDVERVAAYCSFTPEEQGRLRAAVLVVGIQRLLMERVGPEVARQTAEQLLPIIVDALRRSGGADEAIAAFRRESEQIKNDLIQHHHDEAPRDAVLSVALDAIDRATLDLSLSHQVATAVERLEHAQAARTAFATALEALEEADVDLQQSEGWRFWFEEAMQGRNEADELLAELGGAV